MNAPPDPSSSLSAPALATGALLALAATFALLLTAAPAPADAAGQVKGKATGPGKNKADGPVKSVVRVKPYGLKKGRAKIMSTVTAGGSVTPWRPGQRVQVSFFHNGKRYQLRKVKLKKGKGDYGTFRTSIVTRKGGKYAVQAKYWGKAGKDPVSRDSSARKSWKVSFTALHKGQCGKVIRGFRKALNRLALVPGGGKCFNGKMERAVLAYRKLNRMSRNAIASKSVVKRIFNGKGGYRVRKPGLGDHMEAPLSRQVIVFAKGKKPYAIFPTASGAPATPTILGTFSFYWKDPGYNSLGMYYSSYFIRGYATHGYKSVPNYPASHGCLRTFIADQPRVYNITQLGMPVYTFGNAFRSNDSLEIWDSSGDLGPDQGPAGGLNPAA